METQNLISKEKAKLLNACEKNPLQDQPKIEDKIEEKQENTTGSKRVEKNQKKYILRPNNKGNGMMNSHNEETGATSSKRPASRSIHHIENEVNRVGHNCSNSNGNQSLSSKRILRSEMGRKK